MTNSTLRIPDSAFDNPYVGPRPFEEEERQLFFGRREETRQLADLVIAQRVVVFHAPSGAGKTSLLKASLIPLLKELKKIIVLPITRVSGDLPHDVAPSTVQNIYVFNSLVLLQGQATKATGLASCSLQEGLQSLLAPQEGERRPRPRLLIIDQFEELFTTHLDRHPERADFCRQLQACLAANPQLSLLLSMREDYIANLDFYAAQLPDRLRTRFRIERLSEKDALDAITGPAAAAGRPFDTGVAEALVDNLRRVQLGQPDSEMPRVTLALGTYIEPVHLQIVCRQLWEKLPPERTTILAEDVQKFGDVDQALIGFYEGVLASVVAQTGVSQRRLRNWFNEHLITPARTRGLVYQAETQTADLENTAVDLLNNAYIIRADIRGNDTWYELAHDRLVEPILAANATWNAQHFNPLAAPTTAWLQNGRDPTRLLQGERLAEAQAYAQSNPDDLLPEEREFLADSLRQQAIADEGARQAAQRRRNLAFAALGVILTLSLLTLWALSNAAEARRQAAIAEARRLEAEAQTRLATSRELAAAAVSNLTTDPELSILLALNAISTTYTIQAEGALHQALQTSRIQHTRYGHAGAVNAVAISSDGGRWATGGADGVVKLWDGATGAEVATLPGVPAAVNDVAFSPNGRWLAVASDAGYTQLWPLTDQIGASQPLTLTGHNARVVSLAFSPDNTRLATSGFDAAIRLWSLADTSLGQPLQVITNTVQPIISTALAFSPDGARLTAGRGDGSVVTWGVASRRQLLTFVGHTARVFDLAISPDGAKLATGAWSGAKLWDATTGALLYTLGGHTAEVHGVAFSPDGAHLATASADQRLILWDITYGQPRQTLAGHKGAVLDLAFTPDGKSLLSASADGSTRQWNLGPTREVATFADPGELFDIIFTPDGSRLTSLWNDGTLRVWDLMSSQRVVSYTVHSPNRSGSADFSDDGRRLAVGVEGEPLTVWDLEVGQRSKIFSPGGRESYVALALNFDGSKLATADVVQTLELWSVVDGRSLFTLGRQRAEARDLAFHPAGDYLAAANADGTVRVWDANTGSPMMITLTGHVGEVRQLVFSPDGRSLATAGADGLALLWELQDLSQPNLTPVRLVGHTARLSSIVYSPDGARLATSSGDKTAKVWDTATGQELLTFGGDNAALVAATFSPDGRLLATGSMDGVIRVYTLDVTQLTALARSRVTRPLTTEECVKYRCKEELTHDLRSAR